MRRRNRLAWLAASAAAAIPGCRPAGPWHVEEADPRAVRTIAQGQVIGGEGRYGSQAWLGIPFAAPPVGALRWRAPRPPAPWTGLRKALDFAPACPQLPNPLGGPSGGKEVAGNEDCLYLNVWTPPFDPDAVPRGADRLPVMLWIHGGGNSIGSAAFYDPGRLAASRGVVVVSTQYRLGPLGWFRHPALRAGADAVDASGNYGTLDLIQALRWVRENVAAFGGDPGNVTIFGESAGGLNVYTMLLSPLARGLFQRAIVESGGLAHATVEEAERFDDQQTGSERNGSSEILARLLVAGGRARDRDAAKGAIARMPDSEIAAYLRGKSPAELIHAYGKSLLGMLQMPLVFGDGTVLPEGDWLEKLSTSGGWNEVPVILGTNEDEAKLFFFFDPRRIRKILGVLPRFVDERTYEAAAAYLSRAWKAAGADAPAAAMRQSGAGAVYVYRFDWRGEPTVYGADIARMLGAAHGLEIPFVFGRFDLGPFSEYLFPKSTAPSREDLSGAMMGYWTTFARTGAPGRGGANYAEWQSWDPGQEALKTLHLDAPPDRIKMTVGRETVGDVAAEVVADTVLALRDKCRVLYAMQTGIHAASPEVTAAEVRLGCGQFRLGNRPWADLAP